MDGGLKRRLSIEICSWAQFTFEWTAVGTNPDRWSCRRSGSSHNGFISARWRQLSPGLQRLCHCPTGQSVGASSIFICADGPNGQALITEELGAAENGSNEQSEKFSAFSDQNWEPHQIFGAESVASQNSGVNKAAKVKPRRCAVFTYPCSSSLPA